MTPGCHRLALLLALLLARGAPAWAAPESLNAKSEPAAPTTAKTVKPAAARPRPSLSPRLTAKVAEKLPAWSPPKIEKAEQAPPPPPDPDVVRMEPVIVTESRLPRMDEKEWLTPKALDDVLVKEYLSSFDRDFLNRFTLPLAGISKEARARMMYDEDKRLRDLKWMNDQIDQLSKLDPKAAKELEAIRDTTFLRQGP
jgi:hypothetical protein